MLKHLRQYLTSSRVIKYLGVFLCCIYGILGFCPQSGILDPATSKCYVFGDSNTDWFTAKYTCEINGGYLAKIESQAELDFMQSVQSADHYWFGMNDLAIEGDYRWSDGTPVTWFRWRYDQPNGGSSQNCTAIDNGWTWQDKACENKYRFVCNPSIDQVYYAYLLIHSISDASLLKTETAADRVDCTVICASNIQCFYWAYKATTSSNNCRTYKISPGSSLTMSSSWDYYTIWNA